MPVLTTWISRERENLEYSNPFNLYYFVMTKSNDCYYLQDGKNWTKILSKIIGQLRKTDLSDFLLCCWSQFKFFNTVGELIQFKTYFKLFGRHTFQRFAISNIYL